MKAIREEVEVLIRSCRRIFFLFCVGPRSSPLDSGGDAVASVVVGQRATSERQRGGFVTFAPFPSERFFPLSSKWHAIMCQSSWRGSGVEYIVKREFPSDELKKKGFYSKLDKHNPFRLFLMLRVDPRETRIFFQVTGLRPFRLLDPFL